MMNFSNSTIVVFWSLVGLGAMVFVVLKLWLYDTKSYLGNRALDDKLADLRMSQLLEEVEKCFEQSMKQVNNFIALERRLSDKKAQVARRASKWQKRCKV